METKAEFKTRVNELARVIPGSWMHGSKAGAMLSSAYTSVRIPQLAKWFITCLLSVLVLGIPAKAQVEQEEISVRETVFSAPGLGHAVSGDSTRLIAGGDEAVYVYEREPDGWKHTATLTAGDGVAGDRFGSAVHLTGNFALVGAPHAEVNNLPDAGAAYVFLHLPDGSWVQKARLQSGSPSAGALFGSAVATSAQIYYVIGSPGAGMAEVFEPVTPGQSWFLSAVLSPPDLTGSQAIEAGFGNSAAITIEPGHAVVGAPEANGAGAAYAFRRVDGNWLFGEKLVDSPRSEGARFGQKVNIESVGIIVGAPGQSRLASFLLDTGTGTYIPIGYDLGGTGFGVSIGTGAARVIAGDTTHRVAYMYGRGSTGGVLAGTLVPNLGAPGDQFGASVDINGTVEGIPGAAVVGAPGLSAIHIFDLGSSEESDSAYFEMQSGLSYAASGEIYGQITVTREHGAVVAIEGRGRLLSSTVPAPFVALDLSALGNSSRLAGTMTIHEPATGFEHALKVNTFAHILNETAVSGNGNGLQEPRAPKRRVALDWRVNDLRQ